LTLDEFVRRVLEDNEEELEEIRELQRILGLLSKREPALYAASVTSNA
jgi:hypothetical protein